jgi:transcriptional regulator with XRE-family HTH domain
MSKTRKEGLSRYVERIMKEKHLSRSDVKLRSGGEITDSYVSAIISGVATNLSVEKLKALARGLRVSERKLVNVAFGHSEEFEADRTVDQSHNLILLDIRKKSIISSDVAEIVQEVVKLPAAERAVVLRYVKRLSRVRRKPQRRSRSV